MLEQFQFGSKSVTYTLTMSSEQAHEANKAIELLMRLKLNQFDVLPYNLLDLADERYAKKRDNAMPHLALGFAELYADKKPGEWKDTEWYRLYDLHQVIRKAIHDAEHPETTGVDSYPLMETAGEPMAWCEWKRENG